MVQPEIELKPCPFCGKSNTPIFWDSEEAYGIEGEYSTNEIYFSVSCDASKPGGRNGCGASGGFKKTVEEAAAAWNKRVSNV